MPTNDSDVRGYSPPPSKDESCSRWRTRGALNSSASVVSPPRPGWRPLFVALALCLTLTPVDAACSANSGYYCSSSGAAAPTRCAEGYYQSSSGQSSCSACGNNGCSQTATWSCSANQYVYSGNRWKNCQECPKGYYCNGQTATKVTYGRYATGSATSQATCAAGYYCPSIAESTQKSCPTGHYSTSNSRSCTQTSGGYYSTGSGQSQCASGTYARQGEGSCTACPAGFYCAAGEDIPLPCAGGTYSTGSAASCTNCPNAYYCSLTAVIGTCSNGYTSPAGSPVCTPCAAGYYCQSGVQTACSANYYSYTGATWCTAAAAGYGKDTYKASIGSKCNAGYYSDSATNYDCAVCPQGYYCPPDGSGLYVSKIWCGSSYYCPVGTTSLSTACPDWYDCTSYSMCADGKYLSSDKVTCLDCPAGYTCAGRSWSTNTLITDAGYYSPLGVSTKFICPGGFACSTQQAVACADGYYSIEGAMDCTICDVNWACPNKDLAQSDQIYCPNQRGMYQPSQGQTECIYAPAGTYIRYGETTPTNCPSGTWSAGASETCMECPPGFKCPLTTRPSIWPCTRGTYNLLWNQINCNQCEAGYQCVGEQRSACPTFRYSYAGWGYCLPSPAGFYIPLGDNSYVALCAVGTYAIYGSGDSTKGSATCQTCPVGHSCSDPTRLPQPCPPGYYQGSTGQAICLSCLSNYGAGWYSLFHESECHQTPGGYWLPAPDQVPRFCNPMYQSAASATSCTAVAEGTIAAWTSAGHSTSEPKRDCQWGFHCSSTGEVPLTVKTYNLASGVGGYYLASKQTTTLTQCEAGWYCPYGLSERFPCPAGHYCPVQSSLPTPCPATYYNIHVGMSLLSHCTANTCPAGYYCNEGTKYPQQCVGSCDSSIMFVTAVVTCAAGTYSGNDNPTSASACNTCWEGHYCEEYLASEHKFPTPCPKGTYNPSTGGTSLAACLPCDAGVVCPYHGSREHETGLVVQGGYQSLAKTTSFRPSGGACAAGKYSDATPFLDSIANCATCEDGFLCAEATNTLFNPPTLCPAGSYCTAGVETQCSAGTYSKRVGATSVSTCLPCPAGYFCELGTSDYSANVCDAGYYCIEGSSVSNPTACPTGSYSTATGLKSSSECKICPVGYYCEQDVLTQVWSEVPCPAGTYSSRISLTVEVDGANRGCLPCPAGYVCASSPTFFPIACPVGTYSAASATVCVDCPVGYYCDKEATTNTGYTAIEDGFYYTGGEGLAERPYHITTTYSCPPGYYCVGNTKTACTAGTYQPLYGQTSSAACLTTPPGFYTNVAGATGFWDTPCPTGMYCLAGTKSSVGYALADGQTNYPILCPKGTFRSQTMATHLDDCGQCPAGYVCSEFTTDPAICSPGYYCPQGSESMQACPTGTFGSGYGLTKIEDCSPCFGGRYCSSIASSYVSGLCDQMYYCVQASNTPVPLLKTVGQTTDFLGRVFPIGDECAAGGYCAAGSKFPKPCPAGQYQPNVRAELVSECQDCPAGKYCSGAPTNDRVDILDDMKPYVPKATPTGDCYAGYYCVAAAYSPKQFTAQPGYYTPTTGYSYQVQCLPGTYQPFAAQTGCLQCPIGYYCDASAMTVPKDCPQGYYCPPGSTSGTANPCPIGTYGQHTNLQYSTDCQACTSGVYCGTTGRTSSQGLCTAGHYCLYKATTPTPSGSSTSFGVCPAHHWCGTGVGMGTPNLQGTINASTGQTAQTTILQTQGLYSYTVSDTSTYFSGPTMTTGSCAVGYFCPAGSSWPFSKDNYCSIGQRCPAGSFQATDCLAGTYQPNDLQGTCYTCPAGFYCETTVESDLIDLYCPKGYYCPEGTASSTQNPCPAGTYNDHFGATSRNECVDIPYGYYSSSQAITEVTDAMKCTAGYYCTGASTSATQHSCTTGNYCPAGSPKMISCTAGYRCTTNNLAAPNFQCSAGYYCLTGTGSGNGYTCPAGYYCPPGSARPTPCPAGTYQPNTGKSDPNHCIDCQQGYYCPNPAGTSYSSYPCQAGYYCPTGSVRGNVDICQPGHYCPAGSASMTACNNQYQDQYGATACKNCPSGHYCDSTSRTKCTPQSEGRNYYCPGGAVSVGSITCAGGTYNYVDGSASSADCWDCPPGFYCPTNAADAASKIVICTQGYYCLEGTETPVICPVGFYCPEGTNIPIPCPHGYYGSTQGLYVSTCSGVCTAGYYCKITYQSLNWWDDASLCIDEDYTNCPIGSTSPTQNNCPYGSYCQSGTIIPTPCPIGTYQNVLNAESIDSCIDCTAGQYCYSRGLAAPTLPCEGGYYCEAGSDEKTATECPAGSYCPPGSATHTPCSPGTYQPNEVQQSCIPCPKGFYCLTSGLTLPTVCPAGYYCDHTNVVNYEDYPCPEGSFSYLEGLTSVNNCLQCPYGRYCGLSAEGGPITQIADASECTEYDKCYPTTGDNTFTSSDVTNCAVGEICATNTAVPTLCPPGSYTDPAATTSGVSQSEYCLPCPINKYCPDWGLTVANLENCPDGYVCLGSAIHPSNLDDVTIKLCPIGYYCSQANVDPELPCPVNYYNPKEGQYECQPCAAGHVCESTGISVPDPCPWGYYCPEFDASAGWSTNKFPCPAGTYNSDEYLYEADQCINCPPGKYCLEGSSGFTGYCDEGYVCVGGAEVSNPTGTFTFDDYANSNSGPCPVGHYCPYGSSYPRMCAPGQYQPNTGQAECIDCDPYNYCGEAGLAAVSGRCADGFYCIGASVFAQPFDYQTGRFCDAGHYCPQGEEKECEPGTYSPVKGLALCYSCPPGYYCNADGGTIKPTICTTAHYCPEGTVTPIVCPEGTYTASFQTGLEKKEQCSSCPTGYYCDDGTYDRQKKCGAGYYCHSGAYEKEQQGLECPSGYYCEAGTKLPTACPEGTYTLPGASAEDDCKECPEGYYCVRYKTSSAIIGCPPGFYCPLGANQPIACPKGTFNIQNRAKNLNDCHPCPKGTACDVTGISDSKRKLCPPGYYCEEGETTPRSCPAGTFRSAAGASERGPKSYSLTDIGPACYKCVGGYYCPTKSTVVPELCPKGYYCPEGSEVPIRCQPGYYCSYGVAIPSPCPKGNFCPGGSDLYYKCPFGTYCPPKTPAPIPCPNGMYGSGSSKNFDIESGCRACGRGLYSEDDPTQCLDCLPGYVCVGKTSRARPTNNETDNGYVCPKGHYCPLGSFKPSPCPVGTYAKFEGSKSFQQCIPCKTNYYADLPGQGGCKKCGPTSTSPGASTSCQCVGANREFIKSTGSCLCSRGFQPKNEGPNVDSIEDCEQIVKTVCEVGTQPNLVGDCLDAAGQAKECGRQCPQSGGTMVQGTGLCQCKQIVDVNEVCDAKCRAAMPTVKLGTNGTMTITDVQTGKSSPIDPTQLDGYYGNFKCETTQLETSECNVRTMGMTASGEFTYEFQPNSELVNKTGKKDYTKDLTSERRRQELLRMSGGDRHLQDVVGETTVPRLTNPAVCIKEGDVIFFNVDAPSLNYPVYYKDAFLNSNPQFDYGPFLNLEQMINKGVHVQTFSYIFREKGTYVFTNKASGTMTTITVVSPNEGCSGADESGVGVGMVTNEKLSSFGIKSQEKGIQPDWWFISITIFAILSFLFFAITLFILAHNANIKDTEILAKDRDVRESAIYYDKTLSKDQTYNKYCCGLIRCRNSRVKPDGQTSSSDDDDLGKHELAVKYNDLEYLLAEFNRAQETLNRQLIDREKHQRMLDENGELVEKLSNENSLMQEVKQMFSFVKKNKECLDETLGLQAAPQSDKVSDPALMNKAIKEIENPLARKMGLALNSIIQKATKAETDFNSAIKTVINEKQSEVYHAELEANENMKQKLLDDYQKRLQSNKLNQNERDQLLAELHAKMSHISELAEEEQDRQNHMLNQMLERRRHRKGKLEAAINNLQSKKSSEEDHYQSTIMKIKSDEQREKQRVDDEMAEFEKQQLHELQQSLNRKRLQKTQQAELRLEAFKRKMGQKSDPKSDIKFANMLTEYGNTVKKVDAELADEKAKQLELLDRSIRERKQQRLREIEENRKAKEEETSGETVGVNRKLDAELRQLESLMVPVKDEAQRIKIIVETEKVDDSIAFESSPENAYVADSRVQEALSLIDQTSQDNREITGILKKISTDDEVKRREIQQQRQMIQSQLERANSDDEKFKLMKQLEKFESQVKSQLQAEQSVQNQKLVDAIEARKAKKRALMDKVKKEKANNILSQFQQLTSNKVKSNGPSDEQRIQQLVKRIQAGFSRDESVQVTENLLDEKQQQEVINLMNSLFQERAKALRQLMLDLLAQKQAEFDLLSDEYEPQKELLRQKRVKNLINLEDFTAALERLTVEETERRQDVEIEFADRERNIREEIEKIKLDSDNSQLKALKERQTRDRILMYNAMIQNTKDMDAMQTYLQRSVKETNAELDQYRKFVDKEKAARLKELTEAHEQRLNDLREKQSRLVNVEEQLKRDEVKYMERFKRQREEMLARKLADQQRELLKDMNQKDVDQMLDKHKKDLASLDEILADEQARQMEKMRERLKGRNAERAKQNVVRQIKLAEIQKQRQEERKLAKQYEQAGGDLQTSKALELQKQRMERLTEKAGLMQRMCQKQCYSRRIFFKRHIANQQKLNVFLGRGLTAEWAESAHGSEMDAASGMSQLSLKTADIQAQIREENEVLTYATLLRHIEQADKSYDALRKQK